MLSLFAAKGVDEIEFYVDKIKELLYLKLPDRVIIIAETASGKHPPAARNIRPITDSGIPNVSPITVIIQNII